MRTGPRRLLLLAVVAVVVALAGGLWALWPRSAITRENFAKIREGMTKDQVEAILDGPSRDESTGPIDVDWGNASEGAEWDRMTPEERLRVQFEWFRELRNYSGMPTEWKSDCAVIHVCFDGRGTVMEQTFYPARRMPESVVDKVRRWLHL